MPEVGIDATPTWPVRQVSEHPRAPMPRESWPATVPAIAQVLDAGLDLGPATVLVGANGAGKSTLVEGIAEAFGLNAEGGTRNVRHETRRTTSPLAGHLLLTRSAGAPRGGVFLRAETMYGLFTHLEQNLIGDVLHERSHGEAFLDYLQERAGVRGLWVLDEPESALSFDGCMALLVLLADVLEGGSQVILSTHSPLLAALPGAQMLEVGPWGLRDTAWEDVEAVQHWRRFLYSPVGYLRHLR